MRTPRRASLEIVAVCLATAFLLAIGIQCTPRDAGHIARLEAVGYRAAMASLQRRHTTDSVMGIAQRAEAQVKSQVASNRKLSHRLSETLAANDSILSAYRLNPDDSSQAYTLSVALQRTTEVARLYRDSTEVLLNMVDVMVAASVTEREAWLAERAANAAHIAALDAVIAALKGRECRVLWMPCPTRKQSAALGFAVGVITLAVLIP